MSLWLCSNCGNLQAPNPGPCFKCGHETHYATFGPQSALMYMAFAATEIDECPFRAAFRQSYGEVTE